LIPPSQPFTVTEWDWFQTQLRLLYLELRGPKFVTAFQFRSETNAQSFRSLQLEDEIHVVCHIWCSTVSELVKKKESRDRQLEFYGAWVKSTRTKILELVQQLPTLISEFSVEKNVAFLILDDYGMGGVEVCRFIGDRIEWLADRIGNKTNP